MRSEQPIPNLKLLSGRDHLLHHEGVRDPGGVPPSHESDGHQTLRVFPLGWRGESESHLLFAGPVLAVRLSSSVSSPALWLTTRGSTSKSRRWTGVYLVNTMETDSREIFYQVHVLTFLNILI